MSIHENNELTITFDNDLWKTDFSEIITSVLDDGKPFISSDVWTYDGKNVFRSGSIGHNGTSKTTINFVLNEDGEITFNYKTSCELSRDWLTIIIDDVQVVRKSGNADFTEYSQSLTAGEHTLILRYSKDSSGSSGSDCGAIGYIKFTGVVSPMIRRYFVLVDDVVYSWDGLGLVATDLNYSTLVADDFLNYGFEQIPSGINEILKSYTTFKILYWQEDEERAVPNLIANITGYPTELQTMIFDVDFVKPVEQVVAVFDGSPSMSFSTDGENWFGYVDGNWVESEMYVSNSHLLTETVMSQFTGLVKVKISLPLESELTSLQFIFKEVEKNA